MKTYKTTTGQGFTVDYANSFTAGYGNKEILVVLVNQNGEGKGFVSITSNMIDFDKIAELEGQEKYEALFELVKNQFDDQIIEWQQCKEKKVIYNIESPDGFPISYDWFDTPEAAWNFYHEWKKGFEYQGYYSANHARIPLNSLDENVELMQSEVDDSGE